MYVFYGRPLRVKALRQHWLKVEIIFRGDSGFCRWKLLRGCERRHVRYLVGLAKNTRLKRQSAAWIKRAKALYRAIGKKQRLFASIHYGAHPRGRPRRVIVKAEHGTHGANPGYVVTNLTQTDKYLYDKIYCARGDQENRIKDQ